MMKEEIKTNAEIMLAYTNGAIIQYKNRDKRLDPKWEDCSLDPAFDFGHYNYRVKPENNYVYYYNSRYILWDLKLNNGLIRKKTDIDTYSSIVSIYPDCVLIIKKDSCGIHCKSIDYKSLFENYVWADGSPCGIKEE